MARNRSNTASQSTRTRDTFIQLVFNYAGFAVLLVNGFVLTPLYITTLGPGMYGAWLAIGNILAWVGTLDPGIFRITTQRVAFQVGAGKPKEAFQNFVDGMGVACVLACLPVLLTFFSRYPGYWLSMSAEDQLQLDVALRWSLLGFAVAVVNGPLEALVRGLQRPLFAGVVHLLMHLSAIVLSAYFLLVKGYGVSSLGIAYLGKSSLALTLNLAFLFSIQDGLRSAQVKMPSLRSFWHGFLSYRSGLVIGVSTVLRTQCTYFLAARILSPQAAAMLAVTGYSLEPLNQLVDRTIQAPLSALSHLTGSGRTARVAEVFRSARTLCLLLVFVGVAGVLSLNAVFVDNWVGPHLYGGLQVTTALCFDVALSLMILVHHELFFALGYVREIAMVRFTEGIIRVSVQLGCGAALGLVGIPVGGVISSLVTRLLLIPPLETKSLGVSLNQAAMGAWQEIRVLLSAALVGYAGYLLVTRFQLGYGWLEFAVAALLGTIVCGLLGLVRVTQARAELSKLLSLARGRR